MKKFDSDVVVEAEVFDSNCEDHSFLSEFSSSPASSSENIEPSSVQLKKMGGVEKEDTPDTLQQFEQKDKELRHLESAEPDKTENTEGFNWRDSLAWDKAFFTNAGILEPEELTCIINKGIHNLLVILDQWEQVMQPSYLPELDEIGKGDRFNLHESLAWGNAFSTSAVNMEPSSVQSKKVGDDETEDASGTLEQFGQKDDVLRHLGLAEVDRMENKEGFYWRQSLGWDKAFSTNAGILEPEELTCIINKDIHNLLVILGQWEQVMQPSYLPELDEIGKGESYNFRESLAWDNAFFTSAGVLDPEELACIIYKETQDTVGIIEQRKQVLQTLESPELDETGSSRRYESRQSLTWDKAFFTSPGVLEPEELTWMIKGGDNDERTLLPQIKEDAQRSTDSISSLGSDSLESLEADLLEDIRASMQKFNVAHNTENFTEKTRSEVTKPQNKLATKEDAGHGNKMRAKTMSRMETFRTRALRKSAQQAVATSKDSLSSLCEVSKVTGRAGSDSATSFRSASLAASRINTKKANADGVGSLRVATGEAPRSKSRTALGGSCGSLRRSTSSTKTSSSSSNTAKIEHQSPSSSLGGSGSSLSDKTGDSQLKSTRKNIGSRVSNSPSTSATFKTPTRIISKNRTQSGNMQVPTYLKSEADISPSMSPASSICGWSSDSSSPNSTLNQSSNLLSSLDSKKSSFDINNIKILDSQIHVSDQCLAENDTQVAELLPHHIEKISREMQRRNRTASVKTSDLKEPSKSFCFSSGAKSVHTPGVNKLYHSLIDGSLYKIRGGSASSSRKMDKLGKLKSSESVNFIGNKKLVAKLDATLLGSKTPVVEKLSSSSKVSGTTENINSVSQKVQREAPSKFCRESWLKAMKNGDGRHNIAKHSQDLGSSKTNVVLVSEGKYSSDGGLRTTPESTIPSKRLGESSIDSQQSDEKYTGLLGHMGKTADIRDQANSLCRSFLDMEI